MMRPGLGLQCKNDENNYLFGYIIIPKLFPDGSDVCLIKIKESIPLYLGELS